jgi:hypothetical protein
LTAPAILTGATRTTPTFVGFATAGAGGAPTFPTHQVADECIGIVQRPNATAAVCDAAEGWTAWLSSQTGVSSYTGGGASISYARKVADSTGELWGTWANAASARSFLWVLRGAVADAHNGSVSTNGVVLNWPALTLAPNSFVGAGLVCNTTQIGAISVAPEEGPDGLGTSRLAANAAGAMDVGASLLSTFAPGTTRTLDTATIHSQTVWSAVGV